MLLSNLLYILTIKIPIFLAHTYFTNVTFLSYYRISITKKHDSYTKKMLRKLDMRQKENSKYKRTSFNTKQCIRLKCFIEVSFIIIIYLSVFLKNAHHYLFFVGLEAISGSA